MFYVLCCNPRFAPNWFTRHTCTTLLEAERAAERSEHLGFEVCVVGF